MCRVCFCVDSVGIKRELVGGLENADCDLPAVGDEEAPDGSLHGGHAANASGYFGGDEVVYGMFMSILCA
jgi:hypothetical protein